MRILHTPLNVANDAWSLMQGQRKLGHEVDLACILNNKFANPATIDLTFKNNTSLIRQYRKWQFANRDMPTYDVLHFAAGSSIMDYPSRGKLWWMRDYLAAQKRKQVVAMTYHGCEVRVCEPGGCSMDCDDQDCRDLSKSIERLQMVRNTADIIYVTTPDLLPAVPEAKLLGQSVFGIEQTKQTPPKASGVLRFAHAPTQRGHKGTRYIVAAVDSLRSQGKEIELDLIENVTHEESLKRIALCDVFVDQLGAGWYGVATIEAAAMGKPIVTRIDEKWIQTSNLPAPPFIRAMPDTICETLAEVVDNLHNLAEIGEECRNFVLARHDAVVNAQRTIDDYRAVLEARKGSS